MELQAQSPYQIMTPPNTPFLSQEEVELLKRTMLAKFPDDEKETFIRTCQRTRLDPFTKQIHPTKRYTKVTDSNGNTRKVPTLVTVTGIMGLTAVAERTGNYDGCDIKWSGPDGIWREEWLAQEPPEAARCIVYHKHRSHPEVGIARWKSFVGTQWDQDSKSWVISDFWEKMDDYMLSKCAKAQALRGAFPDQLSNIYIREELESHITDSEADLDLADAQLRKGIEEASKEAAKVPPKPKVVDEPVAPPPAPKPAAPPKPEPVPEPEPVQAAAPETDFGPGATLDEATPEPEWKEHVLLGLKHAKFHRRKIGELQKNELQVLEQQWIPVIREKWDDASDYQKADVAALEAAIAFSKMDRPW